MSSPVYHRLSQPDDPSFQPPKSDIERELVPIYHAFVVSRESEAVEEEQLASPQKLLTATHDNLRCEKETKICKWTLGWTTPLVIILGFVVATASAISNYFFFRYLDTRAVQSSISQRWVSNIAVAIARIFSTSLSMSAGTAYYQLVWHRLRRETVKVSTIDAMLSLTSNPLRLLSLDLSQHPAIYFFGLLWPLIPIGAIFPPSSLVVFLAPNPSTLHSIIVPTFDINYGGDGSFVELKKNALYSMTSDTTYITPRSRPLAIARSALLAGATLAHPSPCGRNCSYIIEFEGPSYMCKEQTAAWLPASSGDYQASGETSNSTFLGTTEYDVYEFGILYPSGGVGRGTNTVCIGYAARYIAAINFTNNIQRFDVEALPLYPLNASLLEDTFLLYPPTTTDWWGIAGAIGGEEVLYTGNNLSYSYKSANMRAVMDSLGKSSLAGMISRFDKTGESIGNTMILQSPFTQYVPSNVSHGASFDTEFTSEVYTFEVHLPPRRLEELLQNVTISMITLGYSNTTADAQVIEWINKYSFDGKLTLVIAYFVPLALSLMFIATGFVALVQNGVSADGGAFLQILCTTTGANLEINRLAARCCIGGSANVSKELKDLPVRFGELSDEKEGSARRVAFGTAGETIPLGKGAPYGGDAFARQ